MQGIAGTYGMRDRTLVRRMLDRLVHRGRDVLDLYDDDKAVLGARCSQDGCVESSAAIAQSDGIAVASDSYLFNREFLRRTISPSSSPQSSDAQLLLDMYRTIGTRLFGYIDGAFAVAIRDGKRVVLARDRYGMKPMYITSDASTGAFSSEIKSQIMSGSAFVPFPPGRMLIAGEGYKAIPGRRVPWAEPVMPENPAERVREMILSSVCDCLGSSKGFNILLSGGLDSSVVAAAASQVTKDLHTVCVGTEDSTDIEMARRVAATIGSDHRELVFDVEDMVDILDDVIYAAETFDYPLVRSCIPNLIAARLFADRKHVTLCGEGGDEVFAGYDSLLQIRSDKVLADERKKLLSDGYLTGFQRVDRMTASASLDGRMPIMSQRIVEYGLSLGRRALLGSKPERNKLVLRKAFEGLLPEEVVWRRKQRFSDGAGSMNSLVKVAEKLISDRGFEKERAALPGGRIRTKEELLYFRTFSKFFPVKSAVNAVGITLRP